MGMGMGMGQPVGGLDLFGASSILQISEYHRVCLCTTQSSGLISSEGWMLNVIVIVIVIRIRIRFRFRHISIGFFLYLFPFLFPFRDLIFKNHIDRTGTRVQPSTIQYHQVHAA